MLRTKIHSNQDEFNLALALCLPAASKGLRARAGAEHTGMETALGSVGASDVENDTERGVAREADSVAE